MTAPHRLRQLLETLEPRETFLQKLSFNCAELPVVWLFGDSQYKYHSSDWLVMGANPLLLAIAAHRGLRHGHDVTVLQVAGDDLWHFPFLRSPEFRRFIDQTLELASRSQLAGEAVNPWLPRLDVAGGDEDEKPVKLWLDDLFSRLIGDSAVELPGRLFRLDPDQIARLADHQRGKDALIRLVPDNEDKPALPDSRVDPIHRLATASFSRVLSTRSRRRIWPETLSLSGRYLFARRVLLCALTNHFAEAESDDEGHLQYQAPQITSIGTADHTPVPRQAVLKQAISDILNAARLDADGMIPVTDASPETDPSDPPPEPAPE
ncbi:MAG: hypothetical protein Alpg2KO_19650 [Alphaproteobacteria bacterium]